MFVSFYVSLEENELVCGDPRRFDDTILPDDGDWVEARWTEKGLVIFSDEDEQEDYRHVVIDNCGSRRALCWYLSPGTDHKALYYFNEHGYHRVDGPAVHYHDGRKEYWLNGKRVRAEDLELDWQ